MKLRFRCASTKWLSVVLIGFFFGNGCGSGVSKPAETVRAPVTGKVTINGEPKEGVLVIFTPVRNTTNSHGGTAVTGADGTFEARNYQNLKGIPPGEYNVTFSWIQTPDGLPVDSSKPPIPGVTAVERIPALWNDPRKAAKHNFLQLSDGGMFDLEYKITGSK